MTAGPPPQAPYTAPTTHPPAPAPTSPPRKTVEDNPLYAAPRTKGSCRLPGVGSGGWKSYKKYMDGVSTCLDRIWLREFAKADMSFWPSRRVFPRHRVRDRRCGLMPSKEADGTYCQRTFTYYVILKYTTGYPQATAYAAELVAHEYAHHVQAQSGISDYEYQATEQARTRKAKDLISRRLELQAECLAGVALHAIRNDLPPWQAFRDQYIGTIPRQWALDHGKLATQLRWLEKGYHSGKPGACDTWSPPPRDVT
ncbi:neutral zinc metallopeptidase [Sphaerisporangium aureirubrum]|uniref:Neutral zinc metallopeptidase n=1 Tax=Sphaerisporangium aureirubrum TaxID=1544736 RepID=A0ABW1N8B9_9ACTN